MVDGRQVFEKEIGNKTWFIKEMGAEDAISISSLIAKVTGTALFTVIASIFTVKEDETDTSFLDNVMNLDKKALKGKGLNKEALEQVDSLKKYSSVLKRLSGVFSIENKGAIADFLEKIHPKDLIYMCKLMLKEAQYIPEGSKMPVNLEFDNYFTATKLAELTKLFIKCLEVNFGGFLSDFLGGNEKDSSQN